MGNQKYKAAQFFGLIISLAASIILPNLSSTILKQNKQGAWIMLQDTVSSIYSQSKSYITVESWEFEQRMSSKINILTT